MASPGEPAPRTNRSGTAIPFASPAESAPSRRISGAAENWPGLEAEGKVTFRYHLVGAHGGAWIYDVESNEELDSLLAQAPVYNVASYEIHALAAMPRIDSAAPADSAAIATWSW